MHIDNGPAAGTHEAAPALTLAAAEPQWQGTAATAQSPTRAQELKPGLRSTSQPPDQQQRRAQPRLNATSTHPGMHTGPTSPRAQQTHTQKMPGATWDHANGAAHQTYAQQYAQRRREPSPAPHRRSSSSFSSGRYGSEAGSIDGTGRAAAAVRQPAYWSPTPPRDSSPPLADLCNDFHRLYESLGQPSNASGTGAQAHYIATQAPVDHPHTETELKARAAAQYSTLVNGPDCAQDGNVVLNNAQAADTAARSEGKGLQGEPAVNASSTRTRNREAEHRHEHHVDATARQRSAGDLDMHPSVSLPPTRSQASPGRAHAIQADHADPTGDFVGGVNTPLRGSPQPWDAPDPTTHSPAPAARARDRQPRYSSPAAARHSPGHSPARAHQSVCSYSFSPGASADAFGPGRDPASGAQFVGLQAGACLGEGWGGHDGMPGSAMVVSRTCHSPLNVVVATCCVCIDPSTLVLSGIATPLAVDLLAIAVQEI